MPNALAQAAERFLRKTLKASDTQAPTVMNVDKNAAYPPPIDHLKADEQLPPNVPTSAGGVFEQTSGAFCTETSARLAKLGMGFCSFG